MKSQITIGIFVSLFAGCQLLNPNHLTEINFATAAEMESTSINAGRAGKILATTPFTEQALSKLFGDGYKIYYGMGAKEGAYTRYYQVVKKGQKDENEDPEQPGVKDSVEYVVYGDSHDDKISHIEILTSAVSTEEARIGTPFNFLFENAYNVCQLGDEQNIICGKGDQKFVRYELTGRWKGPENLIPDDETLKNWEVSKILWYPGQLVNQEGWLQSSDSEGVVSEKVFTQSSIEKIDNDADKENAPIEVASELSPTLNEDEIVTADVKVESLPLAAVKKEEKSSKKQEKTVSQPVMVTAINLGSSRNDVSTRDNTMVRSGGVVISGQEAIAPPPRTYREPQSRERFFNDNNAKLTTQSKNVPNGGIVVEGEKKPATLVIDRSSSATNNRLLNDNAANHSSKTIAPRAIQGESLNGRNINQPVVNTGGVVIAGQELNETRPTLKELRERVKQAQASNGGIVIGESPAKKEHLYDDLRRGGRLLNEDVSTSSLGRIAPRAIQGESLTGSSAHDEAMVNSGGVVIAGQEMKEARPSLKELQERARESQSKISNGGIVIEAQNPQSTPPAVETRTRQRLLNDDVASSPVSPKVSQDEGLTSEKLNQAAGNTRSREQSEPELRASRSEPKNSALLNREAIGGALTREETAKRATTTNNGGISVSGQDITAQTAVKRPTERTVGKKWLND